VQVSEACSLLRKLACQPAVFYILTLPECRRNNEKLVSLLAVPAEGSQPLTFKSGYSRGYWSQFQQILK
jgi:hypothetical protein